MKILLHQGVDVNAANSQGETALMMASASRETTAVRLLLKNNADIHQTSKEGITPLLWTFTMKSSDVLPEGRIAYFLQKIENSRKTAIQNFLEQNALPQDIVNFCMTYL